jgi:hypothetical protein
MQNQRTHKQWWAPVWTGLVMDAEAKHYRTMKSAVWLYLYLLLNANRKTGLLLRKINTVSHDMGVTRDMVLRWLKVLRSAGYVQTLNTGRSLTIQVRRWKALAGVGKIRLLESDISNFSGGKYLTPPQSPVPAVPLRKAAFPTLKAAPNDTNSKKNNNNERYDASDDKREERGFTTIGASVRQERLALELAKALNDAAGINLYRSYATKYPEWLLRKVLAEVQTIPPTKITKGRGALFNYLVQHYAKGVTENPGA